MSSHVIAIRKHDLRSIGFYRTWLQPLESLSNDLVRLSQLSHPHEEAGPNVAIFFYRDLKIVGFVA